MLKGNRQIVAILLNNINTQREYLYTYMCTILI